MNHKDFTELGQIFIQHIHRHFPNSKVIKDVQIYPGWSIFYVVAIENLLFCHFREWAGNPFYFVVERGSRKLAQLDLSKILNENGRFTWYLSKPTNKESIKIYDELFEFVSDVPQDYRRKVKTQKILLKSNPTVFKTGYLFVENASLEELLNQLLNFIKNLYAYSKNPFNWNGKRIKEIQSQPIKPNIFNLEDLEAEEGYKQDKVYLYTQRNRDIVEKRKALDNYTCQICGFKFELDGKKIIECHHLYPLSDGEVRITKIEDLVSVCPTCHRIIHLRKPPFTVDEVKKLLGRN